MVLRFQRLAHAAVWHCLCLERPILRTRSARTERLVRQTSLYNTCRRIARGRLTSFDCGALSLVRRGIVGGRLTLSWLIRRFRLPLQDWDLTRPDVKLGLAFPVCSPQIVDQVVRSHEVRTGTRLNRRFGQGHAEMCLAQMTLLAFVNEPQGA